jgi:hypothetical protein
MFIFVRSISMRCLGLLVVFLLSGVGRGARYAIRNQPALLGR